MVSWFAPLLFALLLLGANAQSLRFALGIVRLDGRIVPFAAYDNGRWERAWPEADEAVEGNPTLGNTPNAWRTRGERVPEAWHVWPISGAKLIQAHVSGVEVVEAHCSAQIALRTDIQPQPGDHYTKFGVATDSNLPLRNIHEVARSDAMWRNAERLIVAEFDRLEAAKAQQDRMQLIRESPRPVPKIVSLYRETTSSRSPMYFVAERKYRTDRFLEDPGCSAVTIVTGWLVAADARTLVLRDPQVFLTNCDAKEARIGLPLAALHVADQVFWIIQEHGYEDETYGIVEIGSAEVTHPIKVNGGGC